MKLVVTVDTEEDQWGQYQALRYTTVNSRRLPEFHDICRQHGVRPTYLVTYEMARQDEAAQVLDQLLADGSAELGAHCHPWNTPPGSEGTPQGSMLCNLPPSTQRAKLETLTELLTLRFGRRPTSFRAGRWGFDLTVGQHLAELGYTVDSSVTPYLSWRDQHGPDYTRGYPEAFWLGLPAGQLLEVPATVGYLQEDTTRANARLQRILRSPLLRRIGTYGMLNRLGVLNRVWLCPEMHSLDEMIALTRALLKRGAGIANLMFHSVTLEAGLSPFVATTKDAARFLARIRGYFAFCRDTGLASACLNEFPRAEPGSFPVQGL